LKHINRTTGVTTSLARLTFDAPFRPFVHRWEQFNKAIHEQNDDTTKEHLMLLFTTLKEELKETIAAKDDFIANGVITYEHLWTIFQPGCNVYSTEDGRDFATKFVHGHYIEHQKYGPCYQLQCSTVNWDGEKFGYATKYTLVPSFLGTKPITQLQSFPLEFHPNCAVVTERLIARGKLFEHYQGYHYKAYKGIAIMQTRCGPAKVNVDSRIIIDRYAHGRFNPNQHLSLSPLSRTIKEPRNEADFDDDDDEEEDSYYEESDEEMDIDNNESLAKAKAMKRIPLTKDQLLICTTLVSGYALKTKRWLEFFVDLVYDIVWNKNAFESLVLPEDQKELILSFAESQILYKQKFDDFVSGKGKGIIMLLSGVSSIQYYHVWS
jgi:hypothetical protein